MKNGVHSSNSNFFQHMAIFTIYFGICLFGLLIRDYYRVPSSYIIHEILNIFDGLYILSALIYSIITLEEFSYQNFKLDSFISVNDPIRVLFLFSCILTMPMLSARFTCLIITDDVLYVFATFLRTP
ncbi:unnamed protein product [Rotaria socialis]|uniref:Uncharacterized protein n=1 Tax=Rotaria socialis TaxID=392032 RepID=A0A818BLE9_9BILA|nr:unnamed protein product [Rotaria socialis]CAF3477000.1 unnamed protein product [Rotaria socialis]CAF3526316.1 unnamed protein product [Rotaria socialis]